MLLLVCDLYVDKIIVWNCDSEHYLVCVPLSPVNNAVGV